MDALKYFKQIYTGKKALENHISLFSIVGIFVIAFLKYTASWGNMLVYDDFFLSVPATNIELWMYLFVCVLLLFYMVGYCVKLINQVHFNKETILPDFTLAPFYSFVCVVPLLICWNLYYIITGICGWVLLSYINIPSLYYTFASIMICLIPFYYLVPISFAKRMRYDTKYFDYKLVFKFLSLTLGDVIYASLQFVLMAVVPCVVLSMVFSIDFPEKYLQLSSGLKLAGLCLSAYCELIFFYMFSVNLIDIIKKRIPDFA